MIVDTSALVAVIVDEPDAKAIAATLRAGQGDLRFSAANYLEAGIVVDSARYAEMAHRLDQVIESLQIDVVPVTFAQAKIARQAFRRYGKGNGHKAQLNFGDCFAYALAIERDEPLLFKGNDFSQTDVRQA